MREFVGLFKPSQIDESAGYEPFPADDEPLFTTHPCFDYDGGMNRALTAYTMQLWFILKNGWDGPAIPAEREWVEGKAPIPATNRAVMKQSRGRWLEKEGLLPDTPIGYQFLEGGPAAWRSPRRLDFIRRLFGRLEKVPAAVAKQPVPAVASARVSASPAGKQHAHSAH